MKMNGTGMRIAVVLLALGLSLFAISTAQAQKLGYRASASWRSVAPALGGPISIFSELASQIEATSRGRRSHVLRRDHSRDLYERS